MKGQNDRGSQDAFIVTLVQLQEPLYYYALQLTEDREDASDLVQETSYKALRNRNRLMNNGHFKAWLYTILRNTHINYLRSSHYRQLVYNVDDINGLFDTQLEGGTTMPDDLLERNELRELVSRLPRVYERPINMMLAGYSYKEIARHMNIPIGTVKSRIHLGKQKIKKVYSA